MFSQTLIVSILCYMFKVIPHKEPFVRQQITRGILGSFSFSLGLWGNTNMEMSNATILKFSGKLSAILLARFYLKETISRTKYMILFIGFIGVCLVAKPSFIFGTQTHKNYPLRSYAVIATITGAISVSISTILTKTIVNKVHVLSLIWFFSSVSFVMVLPLQFFKTIESAFINIHYVIFMIFFYLTSQLLQNAGMKVIAASVVTLIQISDTMFGVMYGVLVFKEKLDTYSQMGCLLVFSVNVMLAIEKYLEKKNDKNYHPLEELGYSKNKLVKSTSAR